MNTAPSFKDRASKISYMLALLALPCAELLSDPTTQPLLHNSDITYLGSFYLPRPATGETMGSFDYGGTSLAVSEDGSTLYVGGHVYNSSLGRVAIPDQMGGTATLIEAPVHIPGSVGDNSNSTELAGALAYNGRLIIQKRIAYDNSGSGPTHAVGNLSISGFSSFVRLANLNSAQFGNGYMGLIPPEWRGLLGGPAFAGNSSMSIITKCSNGPSFYVFDPNDVGVITPIPSEPLMYFTFSHPLAEDVANDIWIRADQQNAGIVFPSGTRSVLFFSRHGYGPRTYKVDDGGCGGIHGEGAAPYRRQVTAFDANDLLAVKNGTKNPYDVRPYEWWTLSGPQSTCADFRYSGLAYDPISRRIFAAFEYGTRPEIHVWQVGGTPSNELPRPENLRIQ